MASIYRPTVSRYVDSQGKRCKKGDPGATIVRKKCKKWWGKYTDEEGTVRTAPLSKNRAAALRMLARLLKTGKRQANREYMPKQLLPAAEAAPLVFMDPDRLMELARAGYAPCWVVDEGEPLFRLSTLSRWVRENKAQVTCGAPLIGNLTIFPATEVPLPGEVPEQIATLAGLRRLDMPILRFPPAVYFLVHKGVIVYVGQSIRLLIRTAEHIGAKEFDSVFYLPVPESDLNAVEGTFIRLLRPKYNFDASGRLVAPGRDNPDLAARFAVRGITETCVS